MTSAPSKATAPARGLDMRRLLELARPESGRLVLGTVFLFVGSVAGLAFPQIARTIIDTVLEAGKAAEVDRAAMLLAVIFVIQGVAVGLRHYLFTVAGEHIVTRLRADLYGAIVRRDIAFFDERRTGELTNRLSADTQILQNTVSVNISMALRNVVTAIGGLIALWLTSGKLTLLMIAVVPPATVAAVYFGRTISRISRRAQDALAGAGEVAEETISGIRTVRAFTREPEETRRYSASIQSYFELARTRILATSIFSAAISTVGFGAVAVVFWRGGRLVLDNELSVGDLTQFMLYTLIVAASVGALGTLYADFMKARGAASRVFELLDGTPSIPLTGGRTLDNVKGDVRYESVSFHYPTRPDLPVLRDFSLSIAAGEVVALVGPSGSGKSTVASLLNRFYDPEGGRITIDGEDLRELDATWFRGHVGLVEQEPLLMSMSVRDNIIYGRADADSGEVEDAAITANAHDFILAFPDGYDTEVGERGVQLSGGQKQRVAIARAVLRDPRILILDEATSALDAESEHQVQQALERLMQGRTTLIIAHRLSTVMRADRVVVLDGGRVIEAGTHSELMGANGAYRQLVERQFAAQQDTARTVEATL